MPRPPDSPRVLGDRYELLHQLGSGGAGAVWAGHDRTLDRPVAVKLLHADLADDPAAEARFRTEATAAAKLTHPNAVLVYDVGRDEAGDYLVMELVTGASLAAVLARGRLPYGEAAAIGAMVSSALGTAHRAGIVHRDVKPANVLLTDEGRAKLADFGIARALGDLSSRLTRTGTVLGTARYLAPEQLRDDPLDGRADIYSLGVVLHEALTGEAPFGEGSIIEVAARRLTTSLPAVTELVPGVPPELAEIIDWATQLDPRDRPADGDVLAAALRPLLPSGVEAALAARAASVTDTAPADGPEPPQAMEPQRPAAPARRSHTAVLPSTPPSHGTSPDGDRGPEPTRVVAATGAGPVPDLRPAHPEPATAEERGRRRAAAPWLVGLVVTAVAVATLAILAPGDRGAGDGTGPGDDVAALAVVDAGDHDPLGSDLEERPQDVPNATDGDPDTFWPTQTYNSADLGGLKEGVGLWLTVADTVDLDRIEVTLSEPAGQLQLWVGDGPPTREQLPDAWGRLVGQGTITDTQVRFSLDDREVVGDTVLLWFTELPAGGDGFRAEVREVDIFGG